MGGEQAWVSTTPLPTGFSGRNRSTSGAGRRSSWTASGWSIGWTGWTRGWGVDQNSWAIAVPCENMYFLHTHIISPEASAGSAEKSRAKSQWLGLNGQVHMKDTHSMNENVRELHPASFCFCVGRVASIGSDGFFLPEIRHFLYRWHHFASRINIFWDDRNRRCFFAAILSHGICQDVLHIFEEHGLPSDEVPRFSGGNVGWENLDDLLIFDSYLNQFTWSLRRFLRHLDSTTAWNMKVFNDFISTKNRKESRVFFFSWLAALWSSCGTTKLTTRSSCTFMIRYHMSWWKIFEVKKLPIW